METRPRGWIDDPPPLSRRLRRHGRNLSISGLNSIVGLNTGAHDGHRVGPDQVCSRRSGHLYSALADRRSRKRRRPICAGVQPSAFQASGRLRTVDIRNRHGVGQNVDISLTRVTSRRAWPVRKQRCAIARSELPSSPCRDAK